MATISVNGANFYYEIHGQGQPLVLISGYCADHFVWLPLLEALSKKYQVVIFDNRGVGQTTDTSTDLLTAASMADDTIALIDALKLKQPHILGHSMGGTIAQEAALRAPEKINKLILMATVAKWRRAMLASMQALIMMRDENVNFDIIFTTIASLIVGENYLSNADNVALFKQRLLTNPFPQSLENQKRQFNALTTFDSSERLKDIKPDTLILYANEDLMSLPFDAKFLARHIPQPRLIGFDCGHCINFEMPNELAEQVIHFLG